MAVGRRDTVFDLGIKRLLCDNNEDDESFWAYFSDFVDEEPPPLRFPIPPTLEGTVATATPITQPMFLPTESSTTNTTDNHYQLHVLSDIQNKMDKKPLNDEDIEKFVEQQKNINTKRKTESDLRKWYQWNEEHGETRELKDIPPSELDSLLSHFFVTVRKNDGSLYELDTLSWFQRSIDRHLMQQRKPFSIIRDQQFASSREALKASRKHLKKEGKGNKPNAADALEPADIEQLWESGALGDTDPQTLQYTLWWLIATHMGTRGRDEHHKLRFGDFTVKSTTDGHEYVEFSAERGTKTRSGETEKSTNANSRSFKPKMWATPDRPTRCSVRLYKEFVQRRPPEMCAADSPFYLAVNHYHKPSSFWYKKQPLGVTLLNRIMKELADKGGILGKKDKI